MDGRRRRPAGLQGRGLPLAAQVHRRAGHARGARRPAGAGRATGCRRCPAAAPSPTSTRPSTATSTTRSHREEGGTPAIVESIRAGLVFQLKEAVGADAIREREERRSSAGRSTPGAPTRNIELLGNLEAERLSIVSFVVRHPAAATCTTTSWSRCSTTCSASRRAAAARAPARTATACSASTSSARTSSSARSPRGCEGIKPGWVRVNFNYFISDAVFRVHPRRGRPRRRPRLAAAARLPLRPGHRACGGTAAGRSSRRCACTTSATTPTAACTAASAHATATEDALAGYLDEARRAAGRPAPRPGDGDDDRPAPRAVGRLRGAALVPAPAHNQQGRAAGGTWPPPRRRWWRRWRTCRRASGR